MERPPRGGLSGSNTAGKLCSNAALIKVEAVTPDKGHKNRNCKDGDKITGDGNRLFIFDHELYLFRNYRCRLAFGRHLNNPLNTQHDFGESAERRSF